MRFIQARSAPAEKLLPRPARRTTRMAESAARVASATLSSAMSTSSRALWRSGRFSQRVALAPLRSISMPLMTMLPGSHAEDAEARLLDGRIESRRKAEAQHPPAVGGRDDAIVPEPRAGVIGMTLALVLGADGSLEGFLLLRPGRLHIVLLDLGEDRGRLLAAHHRDARVGPHPKEARAVGPAAHAV